MPIALNTTSNGANVANNVYNFPVLVRLTSSNFSGFGPVQAGGADIRFSKSADYTKALPYQIQRWDATRDLAEIWVLLDTVSGTVRPKRLPCITAMAARQANRTGRRFSVRVIDFVAVWHLPDLTDATGNGHTLMTISAAHQGCRS